MTTIRAVRFVRFGDPSVLEFHERQLDAPLYNQVEVTVSFVGMNPADSKRRQGQTPGVALPGVVGREFSGVVSRVGPSVTQFRKGDPVLGTGEGVLAEKIVVAEGALCKIPQGLSPLVASCLVVAPQTAWKAVASQQIQKDSVVLVTSAAGAVGSIAAQLSVRLGARVFGTAHPANHALLESWGVHPIDYNPDLAETLAHLAPEGIDVVLDQAGEESIRAALSLGVPPERINSVSGAGVKYKTMTVGRVGIDCGIIEKIARLISTEQIELRIAKTLYWTALHEAYELLDTRHAGGKIVLSLPGASDPVS